MSSNTFCVQPWFAFESRPNGNQVCCWMDGDADIDQVRQDLLNGVRSDACKKCWDAEDKGARSRRRQQNLVLDSLLDLSVENIEKLARDGKHSVMLYQIETSNVCNGACIMCGPQSSTKWASVLRLNKKAEHRVTDEVIAGIDYTNARFIEFLGGEPFLEERNLLILQKLREHGNTSCRLSFVTNGNVDMGNDLIEALSSFSNVTICMSIDGIGKIFEYQRWPLSWDKLLANLARFRELEFDVCAHLTLTNVNLPYLDETISWFDEQGLKYYITEVTYPSVFNPNKPMTQETINELDRQDALKGINRQDYLQ